MSQDPGSAAPMSERMQSLLSRAVEDQLSEQRQLAGALTDVRAQLTRLAGQLDSLQAGTSGPGAAALEQAVTGLAGDTREAVRLIGERLDTVGRMVQQRGHDLAEVRAALDEVRASVEEHTKAIGAVGGGLGALPAFGERIDALQGGLAGLHDRLRGLEALTAAVDGVQHRTESTDGVLRELRHAFTGVASRMAELPGRADLEAAFAKSGEQLDVLANRLGRFEAALPSLLERLDSIDASAAAHGNRLDEVREQLAEADTEVPIDPPLEHPALTSIEAALGSLKDRLEDLSEQPAEVPGVAALAERLDEMHESLFGEGGLRDEVQALAAPAESDDAGVEELVAQAVAESEQRLAAHIDEAVLALAEALIRRRSPREAGRSEVIVAAAAMAPPVVGDAEDEAALVESLEDEIADVEDEDVLDGEGDADADADADDESIDLREELIGAAEPAAPVAPDGDSDEPTSKRKPWWRSS